MKSFSQLMDESRDKHEVPDDASEKTVIAHIMFYIEETAKHSVEPVIKQFSEDIVSISFILNMKAVSIMTVKTTQMHR